MTDPKGPVRSIPDTLPTPAGYSHIVSVSGGRTVYIAGQVAMDAQDRFIGEGDFKAQAEQVFANLATAMEVAGGTLADLIKITIFVRDMSQLPALREVRDRFIKPGPGAPASSLIEVSALAHPHFLIEIEGVAWLPEQA